MALKNQRDASTTFLVDKLKRELIMISSPKNADQSTVEGFGREWTTFTQSPSGLTSEGRLAIFDSYFSIFPWNTLPPQSVGADIGCGSGRWAAIVAPRVGHLHA